MQKSKNIGNTYFVEKDCPSQLKKLPERKTTDRIVIIARPEYESNLDDYTLTKTFKGRHFLLNHKYYLPKTPIKS